MVLHHPALLPDDRLYETDYHRWALEQAEALRRAAGHAGLGIDWENVAEEIEGMALHQVSAVQSCLARIIEHLLKLEYSPAVYPRGSWEDSVAVHREQALYELENSPSLRRKMDLGRAYRGAIRMAARGLARDKVPADILPRECPYTLGQVLDHDWWPVNRHGLA
jgi:hypothetical protein